MNRIIWYAALAAIANSAFAIDVSYETSADQSIKRDKSMSVKNGSEAKNSKRKFDTNTNARAASSDVTFDAVAIYSQVADECVRYKTPSVDFGLSIEEDGVIDLNKKSYYENAGSASILLSKIDGVDENGIKKYAGCIIYNSARMAQANLYLQKSIGGRSFSSDEVYRRAGDAWEKAATPKNNFIVSQMKKAEEALAKPCRFMMSKDTIQCGSMNFSFADQTIKNGGVVLSPGDKFFGINSSFRISLSDNNTIGSEVAREDSQSSSRDASLTQTGSNSMNRGSKKTTNVSPFIPK